MTASTAKGGPTVLRFSRVELRRDNTQVLRGVDWEVGAAQRWAVLGPNGSGKTTMLQLACGYLHPTRGTVTVLGRQLGHTDVRSLRQRVAIVSSAVAKLVVPHLQAREVVVAARHGALEPWWHQYRPEERARATHLLEVAGFGHIADRPFGLLSDGERQQVLLARALMTAPELLLLDEPCAGLDMGGRERLLSRLAELAVDVTSPPTVMVTHHVEEVPQGFTHALLLREGKVLVAGPVQQSLTAESLSECFALRLKLVKEDGRWASRAAPPGT